MNRFLALAGLLPVLAACGGDVPSDRTAAISRANEDARMRAQEGRIMNPEALACIKANATEDEWAVISTEKGFAEPILGEVLAREGTQRCFSINNVVIYI